MEDDYCVILGKYMKSFEIWRANLNRYVFMELRRFLGFLRDIFFKCRLFDGLLFLCYM